MKKSKKLLSLVLVGAFLFGVFTPSAMVEAAYRNCYNMRCPTYGSGPAPMDSCRYCREDCCRTCNYGHKDTCLDYGVRY